MIRRLLTPRWVLTTLLVIAAVGVLIRLGIWQLDRLEWRRAFNTRVLAQIDQPALDLNGAFDPAALYDMEYRQAVVTGEYDFSQQVLLRNQEWENQPGYHLLTPLRIAGRDDAVLVDRGWIPLTAADDLSPYDAPGVVSVRGQLRRPQTKPDFGGIPDPTLTPGETRLSAWNIVNVERLQGQMPYPLLPAYLQQAPDPNRTAPPYPSLTEPEITEDSHASYALQWFSFAAILALGYPFYVKRQIWNMDSV